MCTSALNWWMPLLELSPSMYILARLRRPYDLCVLNQTYDMAWPHVLPRSDSSFFVPTYIVYIYAWKSDLHALHKGLYQLDVLIFQSWADCKQSFIYCFWLLIRRLLVLEVPQSDQVENTEKSTVKNSLTEATNCNKGQGWPRGFLCFPLSAL